MYQGIHMERYAVIDVETTGLSPKDERLTEIAIIILEDNQIVEEFTSLINPEKKIPYRITQITRINNQMVQDAPHFFEIAKRIVEMTSNCIFVAHNASFDYRFIQAEFSRYGFDYERKVLDTVKLARKLLPGFRSYSLGNLAAQLGIQINGRHRAYGDAKATAELMLMMLNLDQDLNQLNTKGLHHQMSKEVLNDLPQEIGVYYFFNEKDELIYIGKSNNIHSRVLNHLNNTTTRKAMEMREQIVKVDFELCGSELVALLLESNEIKTHMPIFNRAQRRTSYIWGIYDFVNENGYQCLKAQKTNEENSQALTVFSSKRSAIEELERLTEVHQLCQNLNGLYQSSGTCFHYHIQKCFGACVGEEQTESYNERVQKIITNYQYDNSNLLIIDRGRSNDERSLILIENNIYQGFGFISIEELDQPIEIIKSFVKFYPENKDVSTIIRGYLRRKSPEAVLEF